MNDALFTINDEKQDMKFIVCTDNTYDENGNAIIYLGKYKDDAIYPISDEEKERILDTENWKMEVVGSPVIVSVKKPDAEEKKFAAGPYLAVVILLAGTKSIFYLLDDYKSHH